MVMKETAEDQSDPENTKNNSESAESSPRRTTTKKSVRGIPFRFVVALLGVIGCVLLSSTRYNLSIAIISMVEDPCSAPGTGPCANYQHPFYNLLHYHNPIEDIEREGLMNKRKLDNQTSNNNNNNDEDRFHVIDADSAEINTTITTTTTTSHHHHQQPKNSSREHYLENCHQANIDQKRLHWSEEKQGLSLGAYYYGFAATHVFGGRFSERYGPKWMTAAGLTGAAVLNAFLPLAARFDYVTFVILRVIIGAFHGVVQPALFFMFKKWFPRQEQTKALTMLLVGTSLGLIINVPIAGAIAKLSTRWHDSWSLLFYGGSALHIIWLVLWSCLVTDVPEDHRLIKKNEIYYIRENSNNVFETNLRQFPWRRILRCRVLYASIAAKICWSFNHSVLIDNGPSYLNKLANFTMYDASVYIALIYLATILVFFFSLPLFSVIVRVYGQYFEARCSLTRLRKLFQSIVFLGAAITMFILPSYQCEEYQILALVIVNMITQGFISVGEYPIINEFAGFYSGTVYGIAMTFDSLSRFVAPIIRGELTPKTDTLSNWNTVFYITGALNLVGLVVFEVFASTSIKDWALKREFLKQISENGSNLPKGQKKELKLELQNPNYRRDINTNTEGWRKFKTVTLVQ